MGRRLVAVAGWVVGSIAMVSAEQGLRYRVAVADQLVARQVDLAAAGASARLERPKCRQVLGDFRDATGRTLEDVLAGMQLTTAEYLPALRFIDGRASRTCQPGVMAFTQRHSRVITICPQDDRLGSTGPAQWMLELVVIHEMLHSLGLGEDGPDPTSAQITRQVAARCR